MLAQGSITNAKEDTAYYAATTITTDLSQVGTDLTTSGSSGYETNSSRAAITSPREISVRWEATAAEANRVIVAHGDTGISDETWQIATNGGGQLVFVQNGVTLLKGPVVAAVDYTIHWSTRANPDTTGASDVQLSEVVIYDHTGGSLIQISQFTHATATTSATWALSVGGRWDGAVMQFVPTNIPTKLRVGLAWHTHVEAQEDWVAARTAYAGSITSLDEPIGPMPASSQIGDSGLWAGAWPVGLAARHAGQLRRRGWSPLVNEVRSDPATLDNTYTPAQWVMLAPSSSTYNMRVVDLRWVPVPPGATHAWVRLHVKSWVVAGAAVPVGLRVYSMSRPPLADDEQDPQGEADLSYVGATLTVDHGAGGVGEWVVLGSLPLQVNDGADPKLRGTTFLAFAYAIDPAGASANDTNARVQLRAWHARPAWIFSPPGLTIP